MKTTTTKIMKTDVTSYDPLRSIWIWLGKSNIPNWIKLSLVNTLSHVLAFWTFNAFLTIIARKKLFLQYKLVPSKDIYKKHGLVQAALKSNMSYDFIASPVISWLFERILVGDFKWNRSQAQVQVNQDQNNDDKQHEQGWSCLRFTGALPSLKTTLWQVAVGYVGYDCMFYFTHRLLHSNLLYKRFHKQHHEFVSPIGLSSSYQGALEGLIQMFNWYLPIGFAGWLNKNNGGLHGSSLFWYNCFRWVETVDAHSGYHFPWSPFSYFSIFGGAKAHDIHHSRVFVNYGASVVWDKLLGTGV